MLPTPSTCHIDFSRVYEPAEDSFLLLDTLSSATEIGFLQQRFGNSSKARKPEDEAPSSVVPLLVEIGTGSGVVLSFLLAHATEIFGHGNVIALGTDLNEYACRSTGKTVQTAYAEKQGESPSRASNDMGQNVGVDAATIVRTNEGKNKRRTGLLLSTITADLATPLGSQQVDILVFNPPYVPSPDVPAAPEVTFKVPEKVQDEDEEAFARDSHLLALSYAGGTDGMEVTNRLLEQLPDLLHPERGVAYILLCAQNRPKEVMQRITEWGEGWTVDVVGRSGKTAGWEKLVILRIARGGST